MKGPIFEMEDRICNIAVVGIHQGVWEATAAKELVRLSQDVDEEFTARRMFKDFPFQVRVKDDDLEDLKKVFETVEFFHHERVIGDCKMQNRSVWVTLSDPKEDPNPYFKVAEALLMDPRFIKVFVQAQLVLAYGPVITFDKEP